MNQLLSAILSSPTSLLRWGVFGAVSLVLFVTLLVSNLMTDDRASARVLQRPTWAKVDHAVSGHSVKLKSDERLNYAGIRSPYPNEPFHEQAELRNKELIDDQKARLRFDARQRDRKGRQIAYVSVDGDMVNETLVKEGLAYVRLTPGTRRFAERLLAAQDAARRNRRGLWKKRSRSNERRYPADPKYGNFHRPSCGEVKKIKAERLVTFRKKSKAFDAGFAPCSKCLP